VDEFLDDPAVRVLGLQVAGHVPDVNLIIFEHVCGSSVSILTSRLRFLLRRSAENDVIDLFGSEKCRELCLRLEEWEPCDLPCINAADRRLLQAVVDRKEGRSRAN
jgi:hypothetical protein